MKIHHLGISVLLFAPVLPVAAGSLLTNGSFETGDFSNWSTINNSAFLTADNGSSALFTPYDGNYYALFGGSGDSINQILATTPGATYDINFWINDKYGSSDFVVNWNSTILSELPTTYNSGLANNGWVNFDFQVTATSASTDLAFIDKSGIAFGLDAVSVTPVPEPGTLALAGLGSLGLLALRQRRMK